MWPLPSPANERRVALIVVVVFLIAGCGWILFSDVLLYSVMRDASLVARFETAKGWTFVLLTALLLYVVTMRSTAQLRKTTRTTSAVLESIGDGVLLLGPNRAIAYANPASIRMFGVATLDELVGMTAEEFSRRFHVMYPDGHVVPPDQLASQRVFDEGGPLRYKARLCVPGQREAVVLCTAAAVRTEIEEPPELVVSILHDITDTERLDQQRDELFANAAHALKTPVTVIKSAAQMLTAVSPPGVQRSTHIIERQCARIERLVENLLALSRIRSGTLQLHPAEVDLGSVLEDVAADVARLSEDHEIRVCVAAHPRIRGDRERLQMVLRNAIHVATHSSQPGESVTVRLERDGEDAQIGLSYHREHPLNPVPADPCLDVVDFDDIGVSRYVTATIVEAHGGTLIERLDGSDTVVEIRLPALSDVPQ